MNFGPVPVADAVGASLAHSVRLDGRRLRKGVVLTARDVSALARGGHSEVTVARLTPQDCAEDEAAQRLAAALVPDPEAAGIRLSAPFTGRVNIFAEGPCVARFDTARLLELNQVDPMITLATVPNYTQMAAGGMIATVKIISYGVPYAALERACDLGRGAVNVAVPVFDNAGLIITDIPGGPGVKGADAIEARLQALGMVLHSKVIVQHRVAPLAEAISECNADMILILTGSATSDAMDVAPEALRAAGGEVTRFGMPVDPGNLLFIGRLQGAEVIGLPGCARSMALNGADWVLSRLACGLAVTSADIAGMGVGGLLKEIPSRPMPRTRKPR